MVFALLGVGTIGAMAPQPPIEWPHIELVSSSAYQCVQQDAPNAKSFNKDERILHGLYCGYYALFFARTFIEQAEDQWPAKMNDISCLRAMIKPWEKHLKHKSNLRTDDFEGTFNDTESGLLNKFKLNEGIVVIDSLEVLAAWLQGRGQYLTYEMIEQRKRIERGEKVAFVVNTGGHWVVFGVHVVSDGMFDVYQFDSLKKLDLNQERAGALLCAFLEKFNSEQLSDMLLVSSRLAYIVNNSKNVKTDLCAYFNAIQSKRPMAQERFVELARPYGFARDVLATLFEPEAAKSANWFNFCSIL